MAQPPGFTNPQTSMPEAAEGFAPSVVSYRRPPAVRQDRAIRLGALAAKRNSSDAPPVVLRIPEIRAVEEAMLESRQPSMRARIAGGGWRTWIAVVIGAALLTAVLALSSRGVKHSQQPVTPVDDAPAWPATNAPRYTHTAVPTHKEPSPVVAAVPAAEGGALDAERLPKPETLDQNSAVADRRMGFGEEARRDKAATPRPPVSLEGRIETYFDENFK